jgi:hypothetical protein
MHGAGILSHVRRFCESLLVYKERIGALDQRGVARQKLAVTSTRWYRLAYMRGLTFHQLGEHLANPEVRAGYRQIVTKIIAEYCRRTQCHLARFPGPDTLKGVWLTALHPALVFVDAPDSRQAPAVATAEHLDWLVGALGDSSADPRSIWEHTSGFCKALLEYKAQRDAAARSLLPEVREWLPRARAQECALIEGGGDPASGELAQLRHKIRAAELMLTRMAERALV